VFKNAVEMQNQLSASLSPFGGFTLIELLAVLAIVAVLAASVFGVSRTVVERAEVAAGVGNLRQVLVATINYANDNETEIPRVNTLVNGQFRSWDVEIAPYLGVPEANISNANDLRIPLQSIADVLFSPRDNCPLPEGSPNYARRRSWSMPAAPNGETSDERRASRIARNFNEDPLRMVNVEEKSNTLLFVEHHRSENIVGDTNDAISLFPVDVSAQRQADQGRTTKFIYGFMDGSSRYLEGKDTVGKGGLRYPIGPLGSWTATAGD